MGVRLVTDYLDNAVEKFPDKVAFVDEKRKMTFRELHDEAKRIAVSLIRDKVFKQPVAVFLDKQAECISSMMGVAYSGNFYTVLDVKMPLVRIEKILRTLQPAVIVTDSRHEDEVKRFFRGKILLYEKVMKNRIDKSVVECAKSRIIDTDVLYILFTSGSTGNPKGVVLSHKAVVSYVEWGADTFKLGTDTIFGNQTPFYYVMSGFDIYQTIRNGCTMYIIPKMLFSFPMKLLEYMRECRINTVCWVPSVLCLIANFKALPEIHLEDLKMVIFGGEVMPMKQLNMWRREYPDVQFVHTYGQTEMSETCVYYIVDREFDDSELLPIGNRCAPMDIIVLNDDGKEAGKEEVGELCGRGAFLAYGYYNEPEKTAEVFVQNPLNSCYPEIVYRTGDLVKYNERGELIFVSRKDFQIKHMGHRIELGEIEAAASVVEGIERSCCLYDTEKSRIILFYEGNATNTDIQKRMKEILPSHMIPHRTVRLEKIPLNLNGKINREKLKEMLYDNKEEMKK